MQIKPTCCKSALKGYFVSSIINNDENCPISSWCELGQRPCFCFVYAVGSQLINMVAQLPAFLNCGEWF